MVSVIESGSVPGFGGPPLYHHAFDENFYVMEGELAFAPRDVPHTCANPSDAPSRRLIVCAPAGFERYFARMAAERRAENPPEWALLPIPTSTTVGPRIGERRDGGQ